MRKRTRQQHVLSRGLVFVGIFAFYTVLNASGALAQQSELQQQILAPDCSAPGSCEMKAPTINTVNKNAGRPVIRGVYDLAFTKNLRIIFGARVYTLGFDNELTVQGNEWQLDLSALSPPLSAGKYELIVETEGYDGEVRRVRIVVVLTPADIAGAPAKPGDVDNNGTDPDAPSGDTDTDDNGGTPSEERPQPITQDEEMSWVSLVALVMTLVLAGGSYAVLAATRRH